jgi:hypothetical protein
MHCKGLRLRATLFIQRDIGAALKTPNGVPRRPAVPHTDQFQNCGAVSCGA